MPCFSFIKCKFWTGMESLRTPKSVYLLQGKWEDNSKVSEKVFRVSSIQLRQQGLGRRYYFYSTYYYTVWLYFVFIWNHKRIGDNQLIWRTEKYRKQLIWYFSLQGRMGPGLGYHQMCKSLARYISFWDLKTSSWASSLTVRYTDVWWFDLNQILFRNFWPDENESVSF